MKSLTHIYKVDTIELEKVHSAIIDSVKEAISRAHLLELYVYRPQDLIEGIGLSWTNPAHPTAKYLRVISLDSNMLLMERLLLNKGHFNKFIYACDESEDETIALLDKYDFRLFRKTYSEVYPISYLLRKMHEDKNIAAYQLADLLELNQKTSWNSYKK